MREANSTENVNLCTQPVVIDMPEHSTGKMGGTMRLGRKATIFDTSKTDSVLRKLYGNVDVIEERHRHRFEVNPKYISSLENAGMIFVGKDETGQRMEALEISTMTDEDESIRHPYYVAVQFHPEYLSRPLRPSSPYVGLLLAASGQLDSYLKSTVVVPRRKQKLSCSEVADRQQGSAARLSCSENPERQAARPIAVVDKVKSEPSVESLVEPFENAAKV